MKFSIRTTLVTGVDPGDTGKGSPGVLDEAQKRKNLRVLTTGRHETAGRGIEFKRVGGGILVQDPDETCLDEAGLSIVTTRAPTEVEQRDLEFAWRVAWFVKSNAIVFANGGRTIGVGAGQMSRVISARIAAMKAIDEGLTVNKSVMASDAFFPFRDSIDAAAQEGIAAIIQPGGSMRDQEVIDAAPPLSEEGALMALVQAEYEVGVVARRAKMINRTFATAPQLDRTEVSGEVSGDGRFTENAMRATLGALDDMQRRSAEVRERALAALRAAMVAHRRDRGRLTDPAELAMLGRQAEAWRQQDESLANYVADELQPLDSDDQRYFAPEAASYFQTETPTEYASFIYDSVIAAGMGACRAVALPVSEEDNAHYRGIQASKFSGASGVFSMMGNTRDPSGTRFGVYNVRPGPIEGTARSYETVLTSIWDSSYTTNAYGEEVEGGAWRNVDDAEFIFYDGSTEQPTPLRTVANDHTLSDSIQITGLFLSSLAMFLCLATGAFVLAKRKHKHIKASQPEFCLMLCAGATFVAASLIFVSVRFG